MSTSPPDPEALPLVVDLDGTLILSDLLDESFLAALTSRPLAALSSLGSLLSGDRAGAKRRLARASGLDPATVPLRTDLVGFLRGEKEAGRTLVLATASDELLARPLAASLGLFGEVLASDGRRNLGGEEKRRLLVERFGEKGFDYAGDRRADLPVFRSARAAILAGRGARLATEVEAAGTRIAASFPDPSGRRGAVVQAIRVKQLLKGLLVFVPLVAGHVVGPAPLLAAAVAFLALSAVASAACVLHDLIRLASDRRHPEKRRRPFAGGALAIRSGLLLVPPLLAAGAALASAVPRGAQVILAAFLVTTTLHAFWPGRSLLVDVVTLAFLDTLRVLLGGAAAQVPVSPGLLAFAVFVFLALAFAERYVPAGPAVPRPP